MPVSDFGEIGVLVKPDAPNNLVIHWHVTRKTVALVDNRLYGWENGDPIYHTSMGWQAGAKDNSDYFGPTERERSLKPCINRALDYAIKKWPGWRNETH